MPNVCAADGARWSSSPSMRAERPARSARPTPPGRPPRIRRPHDGVGARAIADWLAGAGVTELLVVHDHDPYYGCLAVVDGELVSA
jgi:hypothetical protein